MYIYMNEYIYEYKIKQNIKKNTIIKSTCHHMGVILKGRREGTFDIVGIGHERISFVITTLNEKST